MYFSVCFLSETNVLMSLLPWWFWPLKYLIISLFKHQYTFLNSLDCLAEFFARREAKTIELVELSSTCGCCLSAAASAGQVLLELLTLKERKSLKWGDVMLCIPIDWLFPFSYICLNYNCFFQADSGQHNSQMGLGTEQEEDRLFHSS